MSGIVLWWSTAVVQIMPPKVKTGPYLGSLILLLKSSLKLWDLELRCLYHYLVVLHQFCSNLDPLVKIDFAQEVSSFIISYFWKIKNPVNDFRRNLCVQTFNFALGLHVTFDLLTTSLVLQLQQWDLNCLPVYLISMQIFDPDWPWPTDVFSVFEGISWNLHHFQHWLYLLNYFQSYSIR